MQHKYIRLKSGENGEDVQDGTVSSRSYVRTQAVPLEDAIDGTISSRSCGRLQSLPLEGVQDGTASRRSPQRNVRLHTGPLDVVQFSSPIYFVEENEGFLQIDVMRIGRAEGTVKVMYKTEDGSARAGRQYVAASGEIVLGDEVTTQSIQIGVLRSECWNATLEFKVWLHSPYLCDLGAYLKVCRVKVIDSDTFPSSKYKAELANAEAPGTVSGPALFLEFVKLCFFEVDGVQTKTLLTITLDQMKNFYLYFTLKAGIYMVNTLFDETKHDDPVIETLGRHGAAIALGIMYWMPMFLLHIWDYAKIKLGLNGSICSFLQSSLFRKYLNYSEESRQSVPPSDMQLALLEDAKEVAEGYMGVTELIRLLGKLGVLVSFILAENPSAMQYVVIMPLLMAVFGAFRVRRLSEASELVGERSAEVVALVSEVCDKYRLVADYAQRPKINELFTEKVHHLKQAEVPESIIKLNNRYFPKWLGPAFTGLYIAMNAKQVLDKKIELGGFLAMIGIFGEISADFGELYEVLFQVLQSFDPLQGMTFFFNLPTDLLQWKAVNRRRRELSREARQKAPQDDNIQCIDDYVPIQLVDMSFGYPDSDHMLFRNVTLSVPQGKLVAVVGGRSVGKSTLLQLIAHAIFPDPLGSIFVPTHLRILHVSQAPMILKQSVWHNLVFGCPFVLESDIPRILSILKVMEMTKVVRLVEACLERGEHLPPGSSGNDKQSSPRNAKGLRLSQSSSMASKQSSRTIEMQPVAVAEEDDAEDRGSKDDWYEDLSHSEKVKVHLARALIMNPEVMVLQRPLQHLGGGFVDHMQEHIKNKGFLMPEHSRRSRRPRTIFFTPDSPDQANMADVIWFIDGDKGSVTASQRLDRYTILGASRTQSAGSLDEDCVSHTE